MQKYIGTKILFAKPMTRGEYNDYRGWAIPEDENPADPGYLVEYTDGGGNDSRHAGYISWSPASVFERSYRQITGMSFGLALEALKLGKRVARAGWNGEGMWLSLIGYWQSGDCYYANVFIPSRNTLLPAPFIAMKTVDDMLVPWLASQTDMLADDWRLVEG